MTRQVISTDQGPRTGLPYSQAIRHGDLVYVAGQVAIDPMTGKVVAGDVGAQTRQVLENMKTMLAEGGATLEDVVKVTVFIRNMADFKAIHEVRAQYFPKDPPASTMVEVSRLVDDDLLIEIEATAVLES